MTTLTQDQADRIRREVVKRVSACPATVTLIFIGIQHEIAKRTQSGDQVDEAWLSRFGTWSGWDTYELLERQHWTPEEAELLGRVLFLPWKFFIDYKQAVQVTVTQPQFDDSKRPEPQHIVVKEPPRFSESPPRETSRPTVTVSGL